MVKEITAEISFKESSRFVSKLGLIDFLKVSGSS